MSRQGHLRRPSARAPRRPRRHRPALARAASSWRTARGRCWRPRPSWTCPTSRTRRRPTRARCTATTMSSSARRPAVPTSPHPHVPTSPRPHVPTSADHSAAAARAGRTGHRFMAVLHVELAQGSCFAAAWSVPSGRSGTFWGHHANRRTAALAHAPRSALQELRLPGARGCSRSMLGSPAASVRWQARLPGPWAHPCTGCGAQRFTCAARAGRQAAQGAGHAWGQRVSSHGRHPRLLQPPGCVRKTVHTMPAVLQQ